MLLAEVQPLHQTVTEPIFEPGLRLLPQPPEQPPVTDIAQTPEDLWSRRQAERIIKLASAVLESQVEVEPVAEVLPGPDLLSVLRQAKAGDSTARASVLANVHKEASEISYKAGMITKVDLQASDSGEILQHGQTNKSINFNSLRYVAKAAPEIKARTEAETRNGSRAEDALRRGQLEDNYLVVISRCADLDDERLKELGFYVETKSLAIQLTTQNETGEITLETAFIAGVADEQAERHDQAAAEAFGQRLGVDLSGLSDSQLIDRPLLIPKELVPEGAIDCVAMMDDCIAEVTGQPVFFGQAKPAEDYSQYRQKCFEKDEALRPQAEAAANKLINQAHELMSPVQASQHLHDLVEAEMVQQSVHNTGIDPKVFGEVAAAHIEQARQHVQAGNLSKALQSTYLATKTAQSTSCPAALRESTKTADQSSDDPLENEQLSCPEVKDGDQVNCPFCKKKVRAVVPQKGGEIFCSNRTCKAAHGSVKNSHAKNDTEQ